MTFRAGESGERRLPACNRRQLADDIFREAKFELHHVLFGKLPKRTGWQPVLPRISVLAFEKIICQRMKRFSAAFPKRGQRIVRLAGEPPGFSA